MYGRTPVFGTGRAAAIARDAILTYRHKGYYHLPAFCVMPDHIHLLIVPRSTTRQLSRIIATLKNAICYGLKRAGFAVRWQWGYYDRILREAEQTPEVANYIMMNPVRKRLVSDFREWPYSGIVDRW